MRPSQPEPRLLARRLAFALGLALPLATAGTAWADPRPWADPPAKPAAAPARAAVPDATPDAAANPAKPVASRPDAPVGAEAPRQASGQPSGQTSGQTLGTVAVDAGRTGPKPHRSVHRPPPPDDRGARAARRLAATPAASAPAVEPGPARGDRAVAARALAADYLAAVSGPNEAMVVASPRFYGSRIRFYGRSTTLTALMAEKRGFVRRWPERRYEPRSFRTACVADGRTCTVRALVAFRAASPARGAVSRGATELVLEVSFAGSRPLIVAESGRVVRRGA